MKTVADIGEINILVGEKRWRVDVTYKDQTSNRFFVGLPNEAHDRHGIDMLTLVTQSLRLQLQARPKAVR